MATTLAVDAARKPHMGWGGLANISFGFFGIQIGFVLQNSNMSRIFQTVGASLDDLPALWVAAPLTGLIVQPIIGHLSDKTWNRFGRRRTKRYGQVHVKTFRNRRSPCWILTDYMTFCDSTTVCISNVSNDKAGGSNL